MSGLGALADIGETIMSMHSKMLVPAFLWLLWPPVVR